eukprot:s1408_g17.t1
MPERFTCKSFGAFKSCDVYTPVDTATRPGTMTEPRPPTGASESSRRSGQSVGSRQSRRSATVSVHSRASEVDVMRVPPRHRPVRDGSFLPQAGSFTVTGLPGYTGYVPGKVAENVYGMTFQNANERSAAEAKILRSTGRLPMSYAGRTYDGPAPGAEIPGYTGFIPGRYADNVMGTTFAKGAELAFLSSVTGRERDPSAGRGERRKLRCFSHMMSKKLFHPAVSPFQRSIARSARMRQ